jgi:hypothetical protein
MSEPGGSDFFEEEPDEDDTEEDTCPGCGVAPGELHADGCDIERCPYCGSQLISCLCPASEQGVPADDCMPWTGEWPGVSECREFGWYAKRVEGKGWVRCESEEPGACEDLNRLHDPKEARWDRSNKRFVRASGAKH